MEQFTDAEKARQVLNAARIPDAESLDDGTAAALWDELSWAATCIESYKIVTSKKLKTDQIVHFEEITRLARRLSQLLKNDLTVCRLERFYPDPFHPKAVRRQSFWDIWRLKLRESLAPLVKDIMRLVVGAASGDWQLSVV
jgi:hypothetical protein